MKSKLLFLSTIALMAISSCASNKKSQEESKVSTDSLTSESTSSSISQSESESTSKSSSNESSSSTSESKSESTSSSSLSQSSSSTSESTSSSTSSSDSSSSQQQEDEEAPINFTNTDKDYNDFFNHSNKVDIEINIKNNVIYNLAQYGVSNFTRQEMYHPCETIIKINDEVRFSGEEVGLRMKGNTSKNPGFVDDNGHFYGLSHYKMSFKETFKDEEDNDYYTHDWSDDASGLKARKKRRFGGMKKIDFKWNRNYDNTFTREAYAKYIYRDAGVLAQNITLVKLTVNTETDSYTEIYQAIEVVDGTTMSNYYGSDGGDGNLYKGLYARANLTTDSINGNNLDPESESNTNPTYPLKTNDDGPTYDHTLMRNLISVINKKNVSAKEMETKLKEVAEVDNIIRYCAVAWVVGNPDDLRNNANNTYFYFNSINDRLSIIPYDDDRCFGILNSWPVDMSSLPADSSRMQGMSYNNGDKVWLNNPLLWRIVCQDSSYNTYPLVESFHNQYRSYVEEFANKYLDVELFRSFTEEFYYAPSKDISNPGEDNDTFAHYASNKLNNMFKS